MENRVENFQFGKQSRIQWYDYYKPLGHTVITYSTTRISQKYLVIRLQCVNLSYNQSREVPHLQGQITSRWQSQHCSSSCLMRCPVRSWLTQHCSSHKQPGVCWEGCLWSVPVNLRSSSQSSGSPDVTTFQKQPCILISYNWEGSIERKLPEDGKGLRLAVRIRINI